MKMVAVKAQALDLSNSVLAQSECRDLFLAQPEAENPSVEVTGCVLIDADEQLQPLTSAYLSRGFQNVRLADASVRSYAYRLSYLLDYLKAEGEYQHCNRDEALRSVTVGKLESYIARMHSLGLAPKTVQSRDAAHHDFFNQYLCRSFDRNAPIREDNPYSHGLIYRGKAYPLGIVQPCSLDELEQLIMHTPHERERCIVQAMHDTGLRKSEVPRLTLQAVRDALAFQKLRFITAGLPEAKPLQALYCPLQVLGSKGRRNQVKPRVTLVSRATLERLEDYHKTPLYRRYAKRYATAEVTPAFFNALGEPYTTKNVEKLIERVSRRAVKKGMIRRMISSHKLRHGAAYAILCSHDMGDDYLERLIKVSLTLGHNHQSTSQGYALIPHDAYKQLADPSSLEKTKASEMQLLRNRTSKRICTGDKK